LVSTMSIASVTLDEPDPTQDVYFRSVFRGIMRTHPNPNPKQKIALIRDEIAAISRISRPVLSLRALQDLVIIRFIYNFALRRSEAAAVKVDHLTRHKSGYLLFIPRSKTDQDGDGVDLSIEYGLDEHVDAVRLLDLWRERLGSSRGPLFRHIGEGDELSSDAICDRTIARIIQRAASRIGIAPGEVGAHSLRAGWATQALMDGMPEARVAAHLRHKSFDMLLTYYRPRSERQNLTRALPVGALAELEYNDARMAESMLIGKPF
jgi:integrase